MITQIISYRMFGSEVFYSPTMSWKEWMVVMCLIVLAMAVLYALSNIVLKYYPSLSKRTVMSDVHYSAHYNQKYLKQPHFLDKLRQIKVWKVIVFALIVTFVFIRYFTLAFHDTSFFWF